MKQFLYQSEWLGLDQELRDKLKEVFAINRSEGMKVLNGKLVSDGCSQNDLTAGITIGKMIEYLAGEKTIYKVDTDNSEKIFDELFERVVDKVSRKLTVAKDDIQGIKSTELLVPRALYNKGILPDGLKAKDETKELNDATVEFDNLKIENAVVTGKLNSNTNQNDKTNKGTESESKGAKTESKGDKQTTGDGDDKPSGDDSINAGSGDRQDIQRPKAKDKSKRVGHSSGKGTGKSKKAS